jgi:hypothetical protein
MVGGAESVGAGVEGGAADRERVVADAGGAGRVTEGFQGRGRVQRRDCVIGRRRLAMQRLDCRSAPRPDRC